MFDQTILSYIVIGLVVVLVVLIVSLIQLRSRLKNLCKGKRGKDLEKIITENINNIRELQELQVRTAEIIDAIDGRLQQAVRGVGVVRFNPFGASSGNQSFAAAFLNEQGDGVVISTLYAREKTSIFAKPVTKKKSEHELTKEEKQAIEQAVASL